MGSILGSRQKSSQSSTSTGQGSSKSVQGSQGQSSSFSRSGMNINDLFDRFNANKREVSGYSKQDALNDVQGVLKSQAMDALQSVMPSIAKGTIPSGAYDSTTKTLLQNDANARITANLAKTGLDAIQSYAGIETGVAQTNNQLLGALGQASSGTSESGSQSTQNSFGVSQSQYDQSSTGSGSSKGGSGLFGLFADGGEVEEDSGIGNGAMRSFMDMSGLSRQFMDIQDMSSAARKMMSGEWKEGAKKLAETDLLTADDKASLKQIGAAADMIGSFINNDKDTVDKFTGVTQTSSKVPKTSSVLGYFADGGLVDPSEMMGMPGDGGRVPLTLQKLLHRADGGEIPNYGAANSAPQMPTFVFNIGTGAPPKTEGDPMMSMLGKQMMGPADAATDGMASESMTTPEAAGEAAGEAAAEAAGEEALAALLADGGVVPAGFTKLFARPDGSGDMDGDVDGAIPRNTLTPEQELLAAVKKYNNGGAVRSGESDVQAGGRIRGKQSPTGQDNQVIGVAGGEGIIPKDVMDVPGVPEMLQGLIAKYHTPVRK